MRAFLVGVIFLTGFIFSSTVFACVLSSTRIAFSGLGTRTAWYCKATEEEKRQALLAVKRASCVPERIAESGGPPLTADALDFIPYWYTKGEAENSGPILDCHLTLRTPNNERGAEHRSGVHAMAYGHRLIATPPPIRGRAPANARFLGIEFEVSDLSAFERDCPSTGCTEILRELCIQKVANAQPQQRLGTKGILGLLFDPQLFVMGGSF